MAAERSLQGKDALAGVPGVSTGVVKMIDRPQAALSRRWPFPESVMTFSGALFYPRCFSRGAVRDSAKIRGMEPYRAVSGASNFRNDGWAQAVKNLSAISGYFEGDRVAEERHFMDGRPRNFTKDA
jgi:hypothetical protein